MTHRALARLAVAAALAAAAACARVRPVPAGAAADGAQARAFVIRGHGRLLLSLPSGWTAAESDEADAPGPAIRIVSPGAKFLLLLSPLWNPGEPEPPQARADTARLFAELARRRALAGSVEKEIELQELEGTVENFRYTRPTAKNTKGQRMIRCLYDYIAYDE